MARYLTFAGTMTALNVESGFCANQRKGIFLFFMGRLMKLAILVKSFESVFNKSQFQSSCAILVALSVRSVDQCS